MLEVNPVAMAAWLQLAAAALALFYAAFWLSRSQSAARSILKTVPVALLCIATLVAGSHPLLSVALAASAAGDWFLANEGEKEFLMGLAAFLAAHLFYTVFFAQGIEPGALLQQDTMFAALIILALCALVLIRLWPFLANLHLPVSIYSLAISAMAITGLAAQPARVTLAGIALFLVSDIILAFDRFTPLSNTLLRRFAPYAVWFLYFGGQAMIVYGLLHAGGFNG